MSVWLSSLGNAIMKIRIPFMPDLPRPKPVARRVVTAGAIAGILAVTLFLDGELIGVVVAAVWSLSSIFHLPWAFCAILATALAVPALWACIAVAIMVYDAETDPANRRA